MFLVLSINKRHLPRDRHFDRASTRLHKQCLTAKGETSGH